MAVRHREVDVECVQFHPESVLTEGGYQMLANWLARCGDADAPARAAGLLGLLREQRVDLTSAFRSLSSAARGDLDPVRRLFAEPDPVDAWLVRWYGRIGPDRDAVAAAMDAVNPVYIARNHLVEEALAAGTDGDLAPVERLLDVLADPFRERPGLERYAEPAPAAFGPSGAHR